MRLAGYIFATLGVLGVGLLLTLVVPLLSFARNRGYQFQSARLAGWNLVIYLGDPTVPVGSFVILPWWLPVAALVFLVCAWALLSIDDRDRRPKL